MTDKQKCLNIIKLCKDNPKLFKQLSSASDNFFTIKNSKLELRVSIGGTFFTKPFFTIRDNQRFYYNMDEIIELLPLEVKKLFLFNLDLFQLEDR